MADDSKFPNLGGNGFIWILLVAAGTYLVAQQQVSLQGSRPASTERSIAERVGEQHVDARLWQDPLRPLPTILQSHRASSGRTAAATTADPKASKRTVVRR
jgi:hypothetical protein